MKTIFKGYFMDNVSVNVNLRDSLNRLDMLDTPSDQTTVFHMAKKSKPMPVVDIISQKCPILILTAFLDHQEVAKLCKANRTWRQNNKGCNSSLVVSALVLQGLNMKNYNRLIEYNKKFNLNIFPCERACVFDMKVHIFFSDESAKYLSEEIVTNLPNLQVLNNTSLKRKEDIALFEKMTKLKEITFAFGGNPSLDNVSVLTKLTNLEHVSFCNHITDDCLILLSSIISLRKLNIYYSHTITDTGAMSLTRLVKIEELQMSVCNITNINFLSSLTNLKCLVLNSNVGKNIDLPPLNMLTMLQRLELHAFRDVSIDLLKLESLKYVRLYNTRIIYNKDAVHRIFDVHTDGMSVEFKKK